MSAVASDKMRQRGILLSVFFFIASAGWLILLVSHSKHLSHGGAYLVGIGTYPYIALSLSWMNSNFIGYTKRAGGLASMNMIGQTFSIVGTKVYSDPPHYYRGNGFGLAATAVGALTALILRLYLVKENARKERERYTEAASPLRTLDPDEIGDRHPDFFYYL